VHLESLDQNQSRRITLQNNKPDPQEQILSLNSALHCGRVCHSGGVEFDYGKWADLQMFICRRTRTTGDEIRDLLSAAEIELQEMIATASPRALLLRRRTINRGFVVII
jgi:hypothetical protein